MRAFKIAIFLCTILFISLSFKNKITEDDVHKMLQSDFKVEANFCGCFGCGKEFVKVFEKDEKRWMEIIYNITSEKPGLVLVEFTPDLQNRLDSFINDALKNKKQGGCTSSYKWKLENKNFTFRFVDNRCSVDAFFNGLIPANR